jgi:hypothetical protein
MIEEICSSETSVLTRATWHNIPGDDILHSHHCENLRSYKTLMHPNNFNVTTGYDMCIFYIIPIAIQAFVDTETLHKLDYTLTLEVVNKSI